MKITLYDRGNAYKLSKREYTDEGFLKAPARVARSGIQEYLAIELGLDGDPNRLVNVYRPADEVFSADSLASYASVDITNDHPPKLIDSKTFKDVTVGVVSSVGTRDGDYVLVELIVKDAAAIKLIESGKAELSAGYTAEYIKEAGVTDGGIEYEFIQRDIKINHVAVVDKARAGSMARIFDNKNPEVGLMKIILDNGRAVELEDGVAAQVEDCISRLTVAAKVSMDKADATQAEKDALEEENEKLKGKSEDSAIAARVLLIGQTNDSAKVLAGVEFVCDSVNVVDIQRAALVSLDNKIDYAGKSDAYISAAFDMEHEKKVEDEEEEEADKKKATDSHAQLAKDLSTSTTDEKKEPSAMQNFKTSINDGWKKTAGVES